MSAERMLSLVWVFLETLVASFARTFGDAIATRIVAAIDADRTAKMVARLAQDYMSRSAARREPTDAE